MVLIFSFFKSFSRVFQIHLVSFVVVLESLNFFFQQSLRLLEFFRPSNLFFKQRLLRIKLVLKFKHKLELRGCLSVWFFLLQVHQLHCLFQVRVLLQKLSIQLGELLYVLFTFVTFELRKYSFNRPLKLVWSSLLLRLLLVLLLCLSHFI